jgi:predicted ester cyclase
MGVSPDRMREGTEEFYAAMNKKDLDGILSRLDDSIVDNQLPPGMPPGKEGAGMVFKMMFEAVPDGKYEILDVIVSGNKAAIRSSFAGTQTGELFGMPATGKSFSVESIDIVEVNDDEKVIEHSGVTDVMGMMMQTGLVKPPPQP